MAGWVRYVWWPLMVLFTAVGAGAVGLGLWRLVAGGWVVGGVVSILFGLVGLVPVAREWPRWREVTYPEQTA